MVGNIRKRKAKKDKGKGGSLSHGYEKVLKQPEKNAQRGPGEKGWACYYCGKEGHLKQDCPQASKPPPTLCPVCKGPHWKRDCPQRCRSPGRTLKTIKTEGASQDNQD